MKQKIQSTSLSVDTTFDVDFARRYKACRLEQGRRQLSSLAAVAKSRRRTVTEFKKQKNTHEKADALEPRNDEGGEGLRTI